MTNILHRTLIGGPFAALLLLLPGCTRTADYVAVIQSQQKAMQEVTDILKTVQDKKDMAKAAEELDERFAKFDAIARKARDLPNPPPPDVEKQIDLPRFKRTVHDMNAEIQRVKDLPGGKEFFAQFEGRTALLPRSAD